MIIVWRIVLIGVALFLAWRVVATGLGSYYAQRMEAGDNGAYEQVLTWLPEHPGALLRQAVRLTDEDAAQSQALLARAYQANPTDPRPLMVMAGQYATAGETARADALMEIATTLTPVDARIQRQLSAYWAERGDAARALRHLSTVMEADRSQRRELVAMLLKVAEDPTARSLLVPYALSPPIWWDEFFKHVALKAGTLEPVRFLYNSRRNVDAAPLTDDERAAYVARLQKDGQISEAYLVWINGLDASEREHLGLLNDGSFEAELTNQGFDWRVARNDRVDVRRLATYGIVGNRALKLTFRANERRFLHLFQPLFLDAGTYRLSGQARGDSLTTKGGLKWQVTCQLPDKQRLGESMRFLGSSDWTQFEFDFEVPESCKSQELRLVSAGNRAFELKIQGDLWFDDMRIMRTAGLSPAARADALTPKDGGETSTPPTSPAKIP